MSMRSMRLILLIWHIVAIETADRAMLNSHRPLGIEHGGTNNKNTRKLSFPRTLITFCGVGSFTLNLGGRYAMFTSNPHDSLLQS